MAVRHYLVTNGYPITKSIQDGIQTLFLEWEQVVDLSGMTRVMLSSDTFGSGGVIIDNDVVVNGRRIERGFGTTFADPFNTWASPWRTPTRPLRRSTSPATCGTTAG